MGEVRRSWEQLKDVAGEPAGQDNKEVKEVALLSWLDIFHANEERGLIREMGLDFTTKWLAVIRDSVSFV